MTQVGLQRDQAGCCWLERPKPAARQHVRTEPKATGRAPAGHHPFEAGRPAAPETQASTIFGAPILGSQSSVYWLNLLWNQFPGMLQVHFLRGVQKIQVD